MFNSLTGIVTGKFSQKLFLENNGIEWEIIVPDISLNKISNLGESAKVYTWLQHTENLMNLYGFYSMEDRNLFFDLIKVEGIGPKAAIKIMSNVESRDLANILETEDLNTLQKIPGVGKKTAAKILLQLKGKLSLTELETSHVKVPAFNDVILSLTEMGYDKKRVEEVVDKIIVQNKNKDSFENLSQNQQEEIIFRLSIVELAQ